MTAKLNPADVPQIATADLNWPMQLLIAKGQGLALLKGLSEHEFRDLENEIWARFQGNAENRLAIALRFRALVDVFAARRLKDMLLERGFKVIAAAIAEASQQRLNTRFGFSVQRLLLAIDRATNPAPQPVFVSVPLRAAA